MRAFISYRAADRARVEPLAAWLRANGVDAFFDGYELRPGDVIVEALERGLQESEAGLIMLSNTGIGVTWTRWELSLMLTRAIERGFRLIPILVDPDAPVPTGLSSLRRIPLDDRAELLAALLGRSTRPPVGDVPDDLGGPRICRLRVAPWGAHGLAVTLRGPDGIAANAKTTGQSTLTELIHVGMPSGMIRAPVQETMASRLVEVGRALGALLFPPSIAAALPPRTPYQLRLELDEPSLAPIPFEAAWIAEHRPIVLQPGVQVGREISADARAMPQLAGPLRVMVVIASPEDEAILDASHELQIVLDAVEGLRRQAEVVVVDGDGPTLERMRELLRQWPPHVVHLTAHGQPGALSLEGKDGRVDPVEPAQLAASLVVDGRPVPLVVLSACSSGVAGAGGGFAEALVAAGVPQVIAMQRSVSDAYATELAGQLYRALVASPIASRAIAIARQEVETRRRERERRGERSRAPDPEYATPAFVARADVWDAPLFDPHARLAAAPRPPSQSIPGLSVKLRLGDFVGRAALRRRLRAAVCPRGRAGALLHGMGGIGKSSLMLDLLHRLQRDRWTAAVPRAMSTGEVCRAVLKAGIALATDDDARKLLADLLVAGMRDDAVEAGAARVLADQPVVLVLDDLHEHVATDRVLADRELAGALQRLVAAADTGAVIVTSRFRLPDLAALDALRVGPLIDDEIRLLLWRLPALGARDDGLAVARSLGGHPRALEFADALVRTSPGARFAHVGDKLRALEAAHGLDLPFADDPDVTIDERVAAARALAAADVMLDTLLAGLDADTLSLLRAIAVYDRPVPLDALKAVDPASHDSTRHRLATLEDRTLVGALDTLAGPRWAVHRWTAEEIWRNHGGRPVDADRAAAAWWRAGDDLSESKAFAALEHLIAAGELDEVFALGKNLASSLRSWGRSADALALCNRLIHVLHDRAHDRARFLLAAASCLLELGRNREALDAASRSTTSLQGLVEQEPDRIDLQSSLSASYNKMADLYRALGDTPEARRLYEADLAISRRLAEHEPDRLDFQRGLSVSCNNLADLHRATGSGVAARSLYEESLSIFRRIAERQPDHVDLQRDLSVSCEKLGDLHRVLGNQSEAHDLYED